MKLEVLISRDENFEPGIRGALKELAVLQTSPSLWRGSCSSSRTRTGGQDLVSRLESGHRLLT